MQTYETFNVLQWLTYLENRHEIIIKMGLSRVREVAHRLDLLKTEATVITIAGTNGKGSTVALLEQLYRQQGYCVAAFTSPHLLHFNERIRVNIKPIDDTSLCQAFCLIESVRGEVVLSYFEVAILAALWYFKKNAAEIILLEVGMGGRLDATNIIDTNLAIITGIDFDHQAYLGNTLEAIAAEKAGIFRSGVPVIVGERQPQQAIVDKASSLGCSLWFLGQAFDYQIVDDCTWSFQCNEAIPIELPRPTIHLNAASCALMAIDYLSSQWPVSHENLTQALRQVFHPGRLQWVREEVNTLFDVAHNPQSVANLAQFLEDSEWPGQVFAVFSALQDKDIEAMAVSMIPCIDKWFIASLDEPRGMSCNQLAGFFKVLDANIEGEYANPLVAYEHAVSQAALTDIIVVFGSFHTVSAVLSQKVRCLYRGNE